MNPQMHQENYQIVVFHQHTKYGQGEHMQGEVYMSPHNLDGLVRFFFILHDFYMLMVLA